MIIQIDGESKCEREGCDFPQMEMIFDGEKIMCVCSRHYSEILNKRRPEYLEGCPNCGCWIPVN